LTLVALSVVRQRLDAVRVVLPGATLTEVAARTGVSHQTLHPWLSGTLLKMPRAQLFPLHNSELWRWFTARPAFLIPATLC
jgi:hypothetical protein